MSISDLCAYHHSRLALGPIHHFRFWSLFDDLSAYRVSLCRPAGIASLKYRLPYCANGLVNNFSSNLTTCFMMRSDSFSVKPAQISSKLTPLTFSIKMYSAPTGLMSGELEPFHEYTSGTGKDNSFLTNSIVATSLAVKWYPGPTIGIGIFAMTSKPSSITSRNTLQFPPSVSLAMEMHAPRPSVSAAIFFKAPTLNLLYRSRRRISSL